MARSFGGFPDAWIPKIEEFSEPSRIAVLMHVHYPELVEELVDQINNIPVPFDFIVTNSSGQDIDSALWRRLDNLRNLIELPVENRGRDILPMLMVVNAGLLDHYDLVLKVHTKKSIWRATHELEGSGEQWRQQLLNSLCGSLENVSRVLGAFHSTRSIGVLTEGESILGDEYWGSNKNCTRRLARRLELALPKDIRFASGSMYWVRGFILQGLRALRLTAADFPSEGGQTDGTTAHAVERLLGVLTHEAGLRTVGHNDVDSDQHSDVEVYRAPRISPRARVVPFYLPQFHTIPENDSWWGRGFTEWTNVTRGKPNYPGHFQPHLPTDSGFYDLRTPGVVEDQTRLAESNGIAGFMYYYYWFGGKRLLELPMQNRLNDENPLPFSIMWANENWTRRWNGRDVDVLMAQDYDAVPASEFIDDIIEFLVDPRYLRVNGRPVISVYRAGQIPNLRETIRTWRDVARDKGLGELFLLAVDVKQSFDGVGEDAESIGFDGYMGFPPHGLERVQVSKRRVEPVTSFRGLICSYALMARESERKNLNRASTENYFPGVLVGFDNTPRIQDDALITYGANPYTFYRWLAASIKAVAWRPVEERLVFVNAWNEWAEGAMLEPSERFGSTYLLAVRDLVF